MPITGQSPLTTINGAKELTLAYQPLLLAQISFAQNATLPATTLYLAPENLDLTLDGNQYQGQDYEPRISGQTLGAIQSISDNGIMQLPSVTLQLADADGFLWNEYELTYGFKGAKMTLIFVFWDPDTNTFSTDQQIKFVGRCNAPSSDESYLSLLATNITQLVNYNMPPVPIGQLCPWSFPTTAAQRLDGANNPDSQFYKCGYSPDVPGGIGNMDPKTGQPFTSCQYTWEQCIAIMGNISNPVNPGSTGPSQITRDQNGRPTARFGGIHWAPPDSWRGVAYLSGQVNQGINDANIAKFTDYFPMVYGTQRIQPPIMNVVGDPNGTMSEVVICVGQVGTSGSSPNPIQQVLVNDFIIPYTLASSDPGQLFWSWVALGTRQGDVNRSPIYNGGSDCYGSLACIAIRVPAQVQASNSLPQVTVLTNGPMIRVWRSTDPTDFVYEFTQNPAWILIDILTYCGLTVADDIDLQSFLDAAAVCDVPVTYMDLTGTQQTHPRYQTGVTLRQRQSAADIVNGILTACRGMLAPNGGVSADVSGRMQLFIKQTLADQQPVPFDGTGSHPQGGNDTSSYNSASGNDSGGTISNLPGYVAYSFDESNILRVGDRSTPSTFKIEQRPLRDTPNRVGVAFQDEDNSWSTNSITIVDTVDIGRINQQITGNAYAATGILNLDQAKRAIQTQFAESYRGNPRGGIGDGSDPNDNDSGGTWIISFEASYRAIHLRMGHIVAVSHAKYGLDKQLFRVISIAPTGNYERIALRLQWHEDDWYLDSYGQAPDPLIQSQNRQLLLRPPFGWMPNQEAPFDGDAIWSDSEFTFSVAQNYSADAAMNPIATLVIVGHLPQNSFSTKASAPYCPSLTEVTGSGLPGGSGLTYYACLTALDADLVSTAPSSPVASVVTSGAIGGLELVNIYWQPGSVGYQLFAGTNPNKLSLQAHSNSSLPNNISITTFITAGQSEPDVMFDHLTLMVKKVWHSGVFGAVVTEVSATSFKIDANGFGVNQFQNYPISVLGQPDVSSPLPLWDFEISSNTSDTFSVSGVTDLTLLPGTGPGEVTGLQVGDVVVMRSLANIASANTIGDANFINAVNYYQEPITIVGAAGTPITLVLATPYSGSSGDEVFVTGVTGNTNANGIFTITVIDPTHIQLDTSTSTGDYGGGGTMQEITHGLRAHEEAGRIVMIIGGKGRYQQAKILDNTTTTCTIDGQWGVIPDATSVFIIVDANWLSSVATSAIQNVDPSKEVTISIPVTNYDEQMLWVQAFSTSASGKYAVTSDSPGREIYVFGGPGNQVVQYYMATFNAFVNVGLIVADDVCMHYIVRRNGTPINITGQLKVPCIGADTHVDMQIVKYDGSFTGSILVSPLVIPAGSTAVTNPVTNFISNLTFHEQDVVLMNITQVGSTQPGQGLVVNIKVNVT